MQSFSSLLKNLRSSKLHGKNEAIKAFMFMIAVADASTGHIDDAICYRWPYGAIVTDLSG